jgi:hypothetical protein
MVNPMDTPPVKNPNFVSRRIGGDLLLIPVRNNAADLDCFFRVNDTGAFILEQIDGGRSGREICKLVASHFAIDAAAADRDTAAFLENLHSIGFIQPSQP